MEVSWCSVDETNKINKIKVNGVDYEIEDSNKATKTSQLVNDTQYVNEIYIDALALSNSEIEDIINNFV